MLFHDALDDRETQASPLLACCHVWFCQAMTVLLGQADAVVRHTDERMSLLQPGFDKNSASRFRFGLLAAFDRLACVFHQIGDCPG